MSAQPAPIFSFDGANTAAQRAAERQAASMVTLISEETRAAIRALIVRAISEGIPPYEAARMIRAMVGMNAQQALAAMNYREQLIDSGLSLDRIDLLLERYIAKKVRQRADLIARTEIMDALNDGALEGWKQARADGLLGAGATKEVIVTPDERLCPVCEPLDGQEQPLDKPFLTADGEFMMPPFHPACRCTAGVNP